MPDRMAQVEALFDQAFDLPESERPEFLRRATSDSELRQKVEQLLRLSGPRTGGQVSLSELGARLRTIAGEVEMVEAPAIGSHVGVYQLTERIGSGGMGLVYRAERIDGVFQQEVALKVLPAGSLSLAEIERFEAERQIQADLNHEHIARLLDGGLDAAGRPFLAMEFVQGLPIDDYCDHLRLNVRQRLELFLTVCRTVQYAHQNLVVHRDLKPHNILVTDNGAVKLLDFGIATVLHAEPESGSLQQPTRLGLSPSFASPEQIEGLPVTTASDVYSLGVLLFQLLCGRLPFEGQKDMAALFAQVLQGDVPKPSAIIETIDDDVSGTTYPSVAALRSTRKRALRRQLGGDLDAIVLKALARDPADRYATAQHLRDDLQSHLAGFPVSAVADSVSYRLRKWATRNALVASLTSFTVLAVSLALVIALQQASHATKAQAKAEHEARVAKQISQVLKDIFEQAKPDPQGEEAIARMLLDPAARRLDSELQDSPEVRAALMNALVAAYFRLGRYESAASLAAQSLALHRQVYTEPNLSLAESQRMMGRLLAARGQPKQAVQVLRASLGTLEAVAGDDWLSIAEGMMILSHALGSAGDDAAAEDLRRQCLEIYRQHLPADDWRVVDAMNNLGNILVRRGQAAEAEPLLRAGLAVRRRGGPESGELVASSLANLAAGLLQLDRLAEAEITAREAVEISQAVFGNRHPRLAERLDSLAQVLVAQEEVDNAEPLARRALEIYAVAHPAGRTRTAQMFSNLAEIELQRGALEAAESFLRQAQEVAQRVAPPRHVIHAQIRGLAGRILVAQGFRQQGLVELTSALKELQQQEAPASLALRRTAAALARLHQQERIAAVPSD